jgi:hypothetical protein
VEEDYFVCIDNSSYQVSLERWKIYHTKNNSVAEAMGLLNVIDESGESYLYPVEMFMKIDIPIELKKNMKRRTG